MEAPEYEGKRRLAPWMKDIVCETAKRTHSFGRGYCLGCCVCVRHAHAFLAKDAPNFN
jgi:hypothetical protein